VIRAVLAVLLAVALLAAAAPAVDAGRAAAAEAGLEAERDRLERVAGRLAAGSAAARPGDPAPRRTVRFRAPDGPAVAPVRYAGVGCPAAVAVAPPHRPPDAAGAAGDASGDCRAAVVYALDGREPRALSIPAVRVTTPEGPVLTTGGAVRLRLRYVRGPAGPTVRVTPG